MTLRIISLKSFVFILCWVMLAGTTGCGIIPEGNVLVLEPAPSGTRLVSGTFFGTNGKTVSGSAEIYLTGSSYVLRLASLSITPADLGLQVFVEHAGGTLNGIPLTATLGSRNYPLSGVPATPTFQRVVIRMGPLGLDYGFANF